MTDRVQVSDNIWREPTRYNRLGWSFSIQLNKHQTWGIPVDIVTSADLRAMADDMDRLQRGQEVTGD